MRPQFWWVGPCLALGGCLGGQSGENPYQPCQGVVYEVVDDDDDSLGFTAADVLGSLGSYDGVEWSELTLSVESDTLDLRVLGIEGRVRIADYAGAGPDCPQADRELIVPVRLAVGIGDGQVDGAGPAELHASAADPAAVAVQAGWELEAELSGGYADAFDVWYAERKAARPDASDWRVETIAAIPFGRWDGLDIDIEVRYANSDSSSASALWRGPATPAP